MLAARPYASLWARDLGWLSQANSAQRAPRPSGAIRRGRAVGLLRGILLGDVLGTSTVAEARSRFPANPRIGALALV